MGRSFDRSATARARGKLDKRLSCGAIYARVVRHYAKAAGVDVPGFCTHNGLDYELGRAVAKLLEAQLVGVLDTDDYLRRVLTESGEFAHYDEAAHDTPEREEVIYPALSCYAETLRDLADAAESREARFEAEARAEEERTARLEEADAVNT